MRSKLLEQAELAAMLEECRPYAKNGKNASYIPLLKNTDPNQLGVCLAYTNGTIAGSGDYNKLFTIQSIVKIIFFTCCLMDQDIEVVSRKISVEPTSDGFNDITSLETKNSNKPLNPMINAGAIACVSLLAGETSTEKSTNILELVRRLAKNPSIMVDEDIYLCEKQTGARNRSIAYYMQSTGILNEATDIEELLDAYFRACSINVTCTDLARIALVYANNGIDPEDGTILIPKKIARVIKATMVMCGMYNESGRVAVRVGLPTKSGVGGGILSIVPDKLGIGIFGPALNEAGSSIAGLALLEKLSNRLDASIF